MKHQFLLFLALLGAVLLWPGCDDDDGIDVTCEVDVPTIPYSVECSPEEVVNLVDLQNSQTGQLPNLPESCSSGPNSRVVRLNQPDGDFHVHLYIGIPATITYDIYGANCDEGFTLLQECEVSKAVAIAADIDDGSSFTDIYVRIKYDIFTTDNYVDYALQPDSYISVAAYDELPKPLGQGGGISYKRDGTSPEFLPFSCDERAFQRIIVTSCNPDAEVSAWAQEIGLPVSEECKVNGVTVTALDVPEGMDPDFVGDGSSGPGGANKPLTTERRPKKDSTDFIVEEDYIITVSDSEDGLYPLTEDCGNPDPGIIGPDNLCFKPTNETLACLTFEPGKSSSGDGDVIITMIDSGADKDGVLSSVFDNYRYKGGNNFKFLKNGGLGYDFIRGDEQPDDEIGHGTATGATVIGGYEGQAPMTVVHYKIFGDQGLASYFGAVVATHAAIDARSHIINMSWGIPQERVPLALACAVQRANEAGIVIVTTAGNAGKSIDDPTGTSPDNEPQWPGAFSDPTFKYDNLLTVGSMIYPTFDLSEEPIKVSYSNFSPLRVDVAAYLTTATPRWRASDLDDINYLAGTSISAPIVTSSLAAYFSLNGVEIIDWRNDRLQQSSPLESLGHVQDGFYLPLCADLLD